jgi:hypothetical protein
MDQPLFNFSNQYLAVVKTIPWRKIQIAGGMKFFNESV